MRQHPILVTGIHRSGSTWIGKTVAVSPQVKYVHEPFNLQIKRANPLRKLGIYTLRSPLKFWFEYVDGKTNKKRQDEILNYIRAFYSISTVSVLHEFFKIRKPSDIKLFFNELKSRSKRPLIKDPLALMSSAFIAEKLNAKVVVSVRHPAAFVASIIRKNWKFDFNNFANQERLLDEHLFPYKEAIISCSKKRLPLVDEAILLWNIIYSFTSKLQDKYKDDWYFVKHEDLSEDPVEEYRKLFQYLSLEFNEIIVSQIQKSTSGEIQDVLNRNAKENIKSWKNVLSNDEITKIKKQTNTVASKFYTEESWS
ncbi:sulfotransferase [uncultured Psychroserpens sp.]|uniref:sulfotransferase n=1 Tax=uncultured Psychroserpens sp. TaxID=255436 RepID=UPI0026213A46|nr:sulfotransferase [uncultured Psychroserpens sp.]